jgi:hypothetical protein
LRETIAALRSRPDKARAQLRLIVSLTDWHRFVGFSTAILEADIRHFAYNGERANSPFELDPQADCIRSVTESTIDGRLGLDEFEAAIGELEQNKRAFFDGIKACRAETEAIVEEFRRKDEIPSFEQFFQDEAESWAFAFAKSVNVCIAEQCARRGLGKLLKIPSVQIMVGHGLSLIYGVAVDGTRVKSSDGQDLQHTVCAAAAAADVFVTHDKHLAFLLNRVPIRGFRVKCLSELLEEFD